MARLAQTGRSRTQQVKTLPRVEHVQNNLWEERNIQERSAAVLTKDSNMKRYTNKTSELACFHTGNQLIVREWCG